MGGTSGACGSSGVAINTDAGCSSSRGGSSSGQVYEQPPRESHAKFRHGLLQLMIHTIDPLHDGQSPAGIIPTLYHSGLSACQHAHVFLFFFNSLASLYIIFP